MDYNFAQIPTVGQKRGPTGTRETLFKRQRLSTDTDFHCRDATDTFSGNFTASSVGTPLLDPQILPPFRSLVSDYDGNTGIATDVRDLNCVEYTSVPGYPSAEYVETERQFLQLPPLGLPCRDITGARSLSRSFSSRSSSPFTTGSLRDRLDDFDIDDHGGLDWGADAATEHTMWTSPYRERSFSMENTNNSEYSDEVNNSRQSLAPTPAVNESTFHISSGGYSSSS
jgi:hypothetical protein